MKKQLAPLGFSRPFPPIPSGGLKAHTRVMIHCVSKSGGSTLDEDVGISFNGDPEVELKDRLAALRRQWHKVTYTTRIAA